MNWGTLVIFSQERVFSHSSSRKRLVVASHVTRRSALLPLLLPPLSGLSDDVVFNKKWPLTGDHHKAQSLSKYRVAENLLCFNAFIYWKLFSPVPHFSSQTVLWVHLSKIKRKHAKMSVLLKGPLCKRVDSWPLDTEALRLLVAIPKLTKWIFNQIG